MTASTSAASGEPVVEVLGIRHHGPGSARSVLTALEALRPDTVLIEGPADADPLLPWVADAGLQPPVALLGYEVGTPAHAVFWPFALFSPEWQAIGWALRHGADVRFCDLPSGAVLAGRAAPVPAPVPAPARENAPSDGGPAVRSDPIAVLADAAGYDDAERWWEDVIEQRPDSAGPHPFAALTAAMAAVRQSAPAAPAREAVVEARREAYMRRVLREVLRGGARRVAVVCGAWHAPALTAPLPPAAHDAATLRGMPRVKAALTWVPWSHSRLAQASGYGAGITSPGWYHHLFTAVDHPVARWFTRVAGELRREDLPVSSAHVIEAVRLADALATVRGRPLPGLAEVTDATLAVLCDGRQTPLRLVTDRLVVGEALGRVPDSAPAVPLAADLAAQARRLRLKQDATERSLDLDLRTPAGGDRSRLLHRLAALDVPWGTPRESEVRATGTFRESWSLLWYPELSVAVIEASLWGTTVEAAAGARIVDLATARGSTLREVTAAVEQALLADLPAVLPELLSALDARAAGDIDVLHLMDAFPGLVRSLRYGDVRRTDTGALAQVTDVLAVRIEAALPAALVGLDDDAAAELRQRLDAVHEALDLRAALPEGAVVRERWLDLLQTLAAHRDVHGLLAGRIVRLLLDAGRWTGEDVALRLERALSAGTSAAGQAAWVEGVLGGGGLVLAHDRVLLGVLDTWVQALPDESFTDALPLVRRTFATFEGGERRLIGERVRRLTPGSARTEAPVDSLEWDVDEARALPALLAADRLLGSAR